MTYAKKKFGQNFLKSKVALEKIVNAAGLGPGDNVLEIGPGRGALTKAILERGAKVLALEIDPDMIQVLKEEFPDEIQNGSLQIQPGDIEKVAVEDITQQPYKLVANIPYYITGLIIRKFLESDTPPESMTLLVQKEVAERIVDGMEGGTVKTKSRGKENILSLSVKVFGDVRYVTTVPAASFSPAPRVDSAVIHISNISNQRLESHGVRTEDFFKVVKAGFAQKRKTLRNNLVQAGHDRELVVDLLQERGLDELVRAEDVLLEDWLVLVQRLKY